MSIWHNLVRSSIIKINLVYGIFSGIINLKFGIFHYYKLQYKMYIIYLLLYIVMQPINSTVNSYLAKKSNDQTNLTLKRVD